MAHQCKWGRNCEILTPDLDAYTRQAKFKSAKENDKATTPIDPAIWGCLQQFIKLEQAVYAKLPLHKFFKHIVFAKHGIS